MQSSWTVTGQLLNPWQIKAEWVDSPATIYGTISNIKVIPKTASKFSVTGIASPFTAPDNGGSSSFFVTALDEYDNRDVNYTSTIAFTSTNGNWDVSPATYGFVSTDYGKKLFNVNLCEAGSGYQVRAWQFNPNNPAIEGWQSPITVEPAQFNGLNLSGITDPQRVGHTTYNVQVEAVDQYGNTYESYNSTVAFDCATDLAMVVSPSQYWFQPGDLGIATFTVTMNTAGSSHDVQAYDINDTAKKGWQYGVTVVTAPVSEATTPTANLHINSLPNLIGTASAYSPASVNKVEIKLYCEDGPVGVEDDKYWQGGGSWQTLPEKWNLTSGTTDWTIAKPSSWPTKAGSSAAKYHLWVKAYDNLGSTETVGGGDYIEFYYDMGTPETGIYVPDGNYVNSKPVLTGTATDPPGNSGTTNANVTQVEIAIKYINAGTTNYWEHYVSSGAWKATETALWIDASALDGTFNETPEEPWQWDTAEVDFQDQTEYYIYSRAYDAAGNVENPANVKTITYDTSEGKVLLPMPKE
jgi:hypothetical protein